MTQISDWKIERHDVVDSTNHVAADRIRDHWNKNLFPAGIVITSKTQNAGKGQHGRSWESPPGGIYLSAIVETIPLPFRDKLALIAGVAVANALIHDDKIPAHLRWPNDILLDGKKVGGILCESLAQGDQWAGIIGIGLNANTPLEAFPATLRPYSTSLISHNHRVRDLPALEHSLLLSLQHILHTLHQQGLAPIVTRARELDSLRGKTLQFTEDDHTRTGLAHGIGDNGELIILLDNRTTSITAATLLSVDGQPLRP